MRKLFALGLTCLLLGLGCLHYANAQIPLLGAGGKFKPTVIPPYTANASDFDGANDYLTRGAGFTGAADSATGLLSFWLRLDAGDGSNLQLIRSDNLAFSLLKTSGNKLRVILRDTTTALSLQFDSNASYTAGATWYNILIAYNTNFSAGNKVKQLYVNNASDLGTVTDASAAFNVGYIATNWAVGATESGTLKFDGCLSEVFFAPGQYLDISDSGNRGKFINGSGKPVSLGSDGSLPTGSAPILYMKNAAASFGTNSGTGGNLSVTGTLDACSTSPSD